MKKILIPALLPGLVLLSSICITSCKSKSDIKGTSSKIVFEKKPGARMTNALGAMEYEFNMVKNPLTGKIPEGVRDLELAEAKQLLANQMMAGQNSQARTAANPYIFQGPNNLGGRTRTIVYDVRFNGTSNQTLLAGGVSGGVYKSTDNGATWVRKSPTNAHFSCTSIAQDTRSGQENTWYYSVGETLGNSASSGAGAFYVGNGVYKSTDNGETWTRLTNSNLGSLEVFDNPADAISKVIVDPTDGNIYAACLATIRRSVDGGTTWTTVLSGTFGNSGQLTDIVVTSSGRLYAAFAGFNTATVDGVWTSAPGATSGDLGNWTQIAGAGNGGSPVGWNGDGAYGRVVLAVAPSSENLLYALYYSANSPGCPGGVEEAELFRWDQTGSTWTSLTVPNEGVCHLGNDPFAVQGGYDLVVAVKPDDPTVVFLGGTNIYRSTTSGATWTRIGGYLAAGTYALYPNSHPDIHSIVFQPNSSVTMLCGNDGGIQRTTNNLAGSVTWSQINTGYRTYQYYHVDIDPRSGFDKVIGGAQDNGSTRNIGGTGTNFEAVMGGDGVSVGLTNLISGTQYEYVGAQQGTIIRRPSTFGSGSGTVITPTGEGGTNAELFVTLFKLDPDNPERLYYANDNALYRTTIASTVISGSWTSMTGVAASVAATHDITALAVSRGTYSAATSSLFIGASDIATPFSNAKLFRLDDPTGVGAATVPVDITSASFPAGAYISSIAVNPRNDDTVLVTFSNYGVTGNVWWTGNANSATPTWVNVEGNLPTPSYRSSAIIISNSVPNYFVGTSVGLYLATINAALPASTTWAQEGPTEIGNAVVSSIATRPADNTLIAGTHGYGMWKTTIPIVVPVTLINFKGTLQNKNVLLEWSTATEQNSKHFELEKSFNGTDYRRIATVPAAGNSSSLLKYSYLDKEPAVESNYYRLKSVDWDGRKKESNVVLVKKPNAQQGIYVLNNPFTNKITIRFIKPPSGKVKLMLMDISGRLVANADHTQLVQQEVSLELSNIGLSKGSYILKVIADGTVFTSKLVRQ